MHDVELESRAMSMPHCFINKVVFKSRDSTFESLCNLSQCENVEFCLHNLPRLTQNSQWCLFGTWCHPGHLTYISNICNPNPRYQNNHEAPFPLHVLSDWKSKLLTTIISSVHSPCFIGSANRWKVTNRYIE